ncbi:uncharacterized protein [Branchiostoma lanceolatum]|uniref:uncharacterized protein n=1 Tax=Branchiostoma lanceolatum TaxID=7740 RepID=UPI0034514439
MSDSEDRQEIRDIRRSLELIQQTLSERSPAAPPQSTSGLPATPQQEMLRSFPGFYRGRGRGRGRGWSRGGQGKGQVPGFQSASTAEMEVQFFLMESNRDKTPQPAAEAAYVAAGLGPKTVTISTSMDHKQVELRLIQAYPKLRQLPGGWLLKKVYQGGSGSRHVINHYKLPVLSGKSHKALNIGDPKSYKAYLFFTVKGQKAQAASTDAEENIPEEGDED